MNGIIVIDKPLGYTSRDIVNIVSGCLKTKRVGHTGTLDPNASGVMVLCIGNALKVCDLLTNHDKEYIAEVILGISTDTLDMDKNATIISEQNVDIDKQKIIDTIASFKGKYMQEVPIYSSVKVNGKKLYEYAREKKEITLPKREVDIIDIKVIDDIKYENGKVYFKIKTSVSKGTYIRSLVRDIGNKLDCPAVMKSLRRTRLGSITISSANTIDEIKDNHYKILKITEVIDDIPVIKVSDEVAFKVKNGVYLENLFKSNMAFITDNNDNLLALYKLENNQNRPYKMFV